MTAKRVAEMTPEELAAAREDWQERTRRVRGKPSPLSFPKINREAAPPNRFDREDCQGCGRLLARGNPVPVQVEGKWKFLCRECRVTAKREND